MRKSPTDIGYFYDDKNFDKWVEELIKRPYLLDRAIFPEPFRNRPEAIEAQKEGFKRRLLKDPIEYFNKGFPLRLKGDKDIIDIVNSRLKEEYGKDADIKSFRRR